MQQHVVGFLKRFKTSNSVARIHVIASLGVVSCYVVLKIGSETGSKHRVVRKVEAIFPDIFSRRTLAKFASISVSLKVRKTKGSSSKQPPNVGLLNRREGYRLEDQFTLAGGQEIVRVYKQNFTGNPTTWDNLMRGYNQRVWEQVES